MPTTTHTTPRLAYLAKSTFLAVVAVGALTPPVHAAVVIDNTSGLTTGRDSTARTLGLFGGIGIYWVGTSFSTGINPGGYNLESFAADLMQPSGNPPQASNDIALRLAVYSISGGLPSQELISVALANPVSSDYIVYDNLGVLEDFILEPSKSYGLVIQAFNPNPTISLSAWFRLPFSTPGFPGYVTSEGFAFSGNFQSGGDAGGSWTSIPDSLLYRLEASAVQQSASVPGPFPIFGAAAAFGFSRKLRKLIKSTGTSVSST